MTARLNRRDAPCARSHNGWAIDLAIALKFANFLHFFKGGGRLAGRAEYGRSFAQVDFRP
jgi:hypothetical protein